MIFFEEMQSSSKNSKPAFLVIRTLSGPGNELYKEQEVVTFAF